MPKVMLILFLHFYLFGIRKIIINNKTSDQQVFQEGIKKSLLLIATLSQNRNVFVCSASLKATAAPNLFSACLINNIYSRQ